MKRVWAAVSVLFVVGASVGVTTAAAAEEPADAAPLTVAETLSAAASAGADTPEELSAAVGAPAEGPGALVFDAEGRVSATVQFDAAPTAAQLDAVRQIARIDQELVFVRALRVSVDAARLTALGELPGVVTVVPDATPTVGAGMPRLVHAAPPPAPDAGCRDFPSDALGPLSAGLVGEEFGVDGTGITIGILSDSFESGKAFATTAADDVALGLLPGPGNPCGYETPVEVLGDYESGDDEGRAMAQLVHGIAPGARILFHTGFTGQLSMANAIFALAQAGADIIVDDLGYAAEPRYQQGVISVAISEVRRQGIAYYSASGNANIIGADATPSAGKPIGAWETEAYRPMACPDWVVAPDGWTSWDCLDFDPGPGEDAANTLGLRDDTRLSMLLSWADPVYDLSTTFLPQMYQNEVPVGTATLVDGQNPNSWVRMSSESPAISGEVDLVVVRGTSHGETGTPALWVSPWGDGKGLSWMEYDESDGTDTVGLSSYGHPADGSGVGVAAADWRTPTAPERFTSPGATTIYFEPVDMLNPVPSAPYATPLEVPGPQLTAVDGNRTSFFAPIPDDQGLHHFFGTSAAAPNAAAVHALAKQYAPSVPEQDVVAAAVDTAVAMVNPYAGHLPDEQVFGAGLIDAEALLGSLPVGALTGLTVSARSDSVIDVSWDAVPGADHYRAELWIGDSLVISMGVSDTSTVWGQLSPETVYTVRVWAVGHSSQAGTAAEARVTTPHPPQPDTTPPAPPAADLGPSPAPGLTLSPATAAAGETVTVAGLPASAWVFGWLYSDPVPLGWAWTGAGGTAAFTIPAGVPAGAHRLAVLAADGSLLGWVALELTAPAPDPAPSVAPVASGGSLSSTGLDVDLAPAVWGALGVLAAGAALAGWGWRRRVVRR